MKNILVIILMIMMSAGLSAQSKFYDFVVKDINGDEFRFDQFKGKKVLVVNTASKCGFTKQYDELQELYEQYNDRGLVIVGFPANNFGNQEPGTNDEILEFCRSNYGVTFPMMSKISVKGDDIHPLYKWLTSKEQNGVEDSNVQWNFQKYLIDENGNLEASFSSKTKPFDSKIIEKLVLLLPLN